MTNPVTVSATALTMQRTFAAPRNRVWRAWSEREELARWFGRGQDYDVDVDQLDLRIGGNWRIVLRSGTRDVRHVVFGTYKEIVPDEKLVFTFAWEPGVLEIGETLVTVEFVDKGRETEMRFVHDLFPTTELREPHREGWTSSFEALDLVLEKS